MFSEMFFFWQNSQNFRPAETDPYTRCIKKNMEIFNGICHEGRGVGGSRDINVFFSFKNGI